MLLAWAGVERYASLVVQSVGKSYFDFCYNANTGKDPLPNYTISQLVNMSGRSRFFVGFFETLSEFRELRHKVAHGTGYFISRPSDIMDRLMAAEGVLKKLCDEELIDNPRELLEKEKVLFHEKCSIDSSLWSRLFLRFPRPIDWNKLLAIVHERFFFLLDKLWEDTGYQNEEPIDDDRTVVNPEKIAESIDSLMKRVSAFLQAANKHVENELYRNMWSSFLSYLVERRELLSIEGDDKKPLCENSNFSFYEKLCEFMPIPSLITESTEVVDFVKDVMTSVDEQIVQLKDEIDVFEAPKDEHERLCMRVRNLLRIIEISVPTELTELKEKLETIKQKHRKLHNLIFTA